VKWIIDEMLPLATAQELRDKGHDAVAVAELAMRGATDGEVFDRAVGEQRIVVTENFADFAALVEQRQRSDEPCTPVAFVRKSSLPSRGALATHLAKRLDQWATANPEPYEGLHWP
jgi:hypothetical protein